MSEKHPTTTERTSERELVVTRTFDAVPRRVFDAWTKPELFQRWWVPRSCGLTMVGCEMDVRAGGTYRLSYVFGDQTEPKDFFGTYVEVVPGARLVWTNDEGEEQVVTTVTFEEEGGRTHLVLRDLYATKDALDAAIACGSTAGAAETYGQLDEVLAPIDA